MWYTLSIPFLCQREVGPISIDSTSFPRVRSQRREGSSRCVSFFSEPPPLSCFFSLRLSQIRNLLSLFQLRFFNYVSLPSTFLRYVIVSLSSNYVRSLSLFQLTLSPLSIIITKPFSHIHCSVQNSILCLENRI